MMRSWYPCRCRTEGSADGVVEPGDGSSTAFTLTGLKPGASASLLFESASTHAPVAAGDVCEACGVERVE